MRPVWLLPRECDWNMPSGPAVYRLYNGRRELIYIGFTDQFISYRIHHHMQRKPWGGQIQYFSLAYYRAIHLGLDAERAAIKAERPLHNLRSAVA